MPSKALALALVGVLTIALPGRPDELAPTPSRLDQRAAERGPIRRRLEAALATPAAAIAAEASGVRREQAASSSTSSGGLSCAAAVLVTLVLLVAGCLLLLLSVDEWYQAPASRSPILHTPDDPHGAATFALVDRRHLGGLRVRLGGVPRR